MSDKLNSKKDKARQLQAMLNRSENSIVEKNNEVRQKFDDKNVNDPTVKAEKYAVDILGLELKDREDWEKYNFKVTLYDENGKEKKQSDKPQKVSVEFQIPEVIPDDQDVISYLKSSRQDIANKIRVDKIQEMVVEKVQLEQRTRIKLIYDFNEVGQEITDAEYKLVDNPSSNLIEDKSIKSSKIDFDQIAKIESNSLDKEIEEKGEGNKIQTSPPEKIEAEANVLNFHLKERSSTPNEISRSTVKDMAPQEQAIVTSDKIPGFRPLEKSQSSKLKYSKKVFEKAKKSSLFFKVKNHQELVKTCSSFYKDFQEGCNSFAISSCGLLDAQKETILGIASYFNYKESFKILIITNSVSDRVFTRHLGRDMVKTTKTLGEHAYNLFTDQSFDLLEYSEFFKIQSVPSFSSYEDSIIKVVDDYDLILWDVPALDELKKFSQVYFPLSSKFGSVSLLAKLKQSKADELTQVADFFNQYGIPIKGIIVKEIK